MKIIEKKETEDEWRSGDVIKAWNNGGSKHYFIVVNIELPEAMERRNPVEKQYGLVAIQSEDDEAGTISIDGIDADLEFGLCCSLGVLERDVKTNWQNVKKVKLEMREV